MSDLVLSVSTPAWTLLTDAEQLRLFALSDYERGRFDLSELERRLERIRESERELYLVSGR